MTINFTKSELANALGVISPYLGKSASVRVKDNTFEMFAWTEHGSALAHIPCKGGDHNWIHIDGVTLQQLVALADESVIELDFTEIGLSMKLPCSLSELRSILIGVPPESVKFGKSSATIKGRELTLLSMMTEAASTDDTRPNLNGIYIAAENDSVKAAAADGYILSFASFDAKNLKAKGNIYSAKGLNRAKRAIKPAEDENVAIGFHKDGIALSVQRGSADFFFEVPTVGGMFPDYMAIVNGTKKAITVTIESKMIASFLKRASAIDGHIYMQVLNGILWLMAMNDEKEKSIDSAAVDAKDESVVMHYSSSLLKDVAKACAPNGKITLNFPAQNNSPMLIEGQTGVVAMPLMNDLKESPFKDLQPALI